MSFYDFFKNLFGIPNSRPDDFNRDRFNANDDEHYDNQFRGPRNEDIWRESEGDNEDRMGFNIFSDPLEMHRYFEHQMNEMLKSFGGMFGESSFSSLPPALEAPQSEDEHPQKNVREHFLKPGYENTKENRANGAKSDSVVDGKVNLDDLDTFLRDKPRQQLSPFQGQPQFRMFGQSISSQTVRRPDGTIETTQTRKDNNGNVETTITKQLNDKQYTLTIRTDKNGRQERIEDMVNLDENEVSKFTKNWDETQDETDLNRLFPFDKFFK
ncbi:uncharacterized protein CBL_06765 [Carabus blaptoides fortunei]